MSHIMILTNTCACYIK